MTPCTARRTLDPVFSKCDVFCTILNDATDCTGLAYIAFFLVSGARGNATGFLALSCLHVCFRLDFLSFFFDAVLCANWTTGFAVVGLVALAFESFTISFVRTTALLFVDRFTFTAFLMIFGVTNTLEKDTFESDVLFFLAVRCNSPFSTPGQPPGYCGRSCWRGAIHGFYFIDN